MARSQNRILALLPKAELTRLEPWFKPIDLPLRRQIYRAGAPIDYAYFLTRGVASSVAYGNGTAIEVATVGDEGVIGLPALFGVASSPNEIYMQIPGDGMRIAAATLRKEAGIGSPLYELLAKYLSAYLYQISQAVACNGTHPVRQRCCRWLLMSHDRVHGDVLKLTQEFLGVMLGVRRASVTDVLRPLQQQGLIRTVRGFITVLDRAGLEAQSCECYGLVAKEYERLLGKRAA
jgi:CRP-like cAMP-binding protein